MLNGRQMTQPFEFSNNLKPFPKHTKRYKIRHNEYLILIFTPATCVSLLM